MKFPLSKWFYLCSGHWKTSTYALENALVPRKIDFGKSNNFSLLMKKILGSFETFQERKKNTH